MRSDQQYRLASAPARRPEAVEPIGLTVARGTVEAVKVTLADEIAAAEHVLEMYRNSWFMSRTRKEWRYWCGEPGQWRLWLAAQATLRRLRRIQTSRRVSERHRTAIRDAVKKKRGSRN